MAQNDFQIILEQIKEPLKMMVKRVNGHHQELDDDDLFQEALLHLWQRLAKGELFDKNKSYILKSCFFYLKNYLRNKCFSYKLTSLETPIDENGTRLQDVLSIEDAYELRSFEKNILIEDIRKCKLTSRENDVLEFFLKGLTTREIAAILNISHVRVVKLISKIKEKYKKGGYQKE
ncbi:MAG: sigma-70 family RNA polymerase sigma factor [Candidatus Omnitrophota bacterium]|nr:sigma-70 family RNA polymerase sigma factor [Candidatus Omnitrophota bacterium]